MVTTRRIGARLIRIAGDALLLCLGSVSLAAQGEELSELALEFVDELEADGLPVAEQIEAIDQAFGLGSEEAIASVRELWKRLYRTGRGAEVLQVFDAAMGGVDQEAEARAWTNYAAWKARFFRSRFQYREAVALGRTISRYRELLEGEDLDQFTFQMAVAMVFTYDIDEGLEYAEACYEGAHELFAAASPEFRWTEDLFTSYRRANGEWLDPKTYAETPVTLQPGDEIEKELFDRHYLFQVTDVIGRRYTNGPARFHSIPFRVEQSGTYTLHMRSCFFDGYLVLRSAADGTVLGEDDDSRGLYNARLVVDLEAGVDYLLEPTALHNRHGVYRVGIDAGEPDDSSWAWREKHLADSRECMDLVDSIESDSWASVRALSHTNRLLNSLDRHDDRVDVAQRAYEMTQRLSSDPRRSLSLGISLAFALRSAGRGVEAVDLLETLYEKNRDDPRGLPTDLVRGLAQSRARRGDMGAADELLRVQQRAWLERDGKGVMYAAIVRDRADIARREGRRGDAVNLLQEAVDTYVALGQREQRGSSQPVGKVYFELAMAQAENGQLEESLPNFEVSLQIHSTYYGSDSTVVAATRTKYAQILNRVGRTDQALEEWGTAYAILESRKTHYLPICKIIGAEIFASKARYDEASELAANAIDRATLAISKGMATLPEPQRLRMMADSEWYVSVGAGIAAQLPEFRMELYRRLLPLKGLIGRGLVESRASARAKFDTRSQEDIAELRSIQSEIAGAFHRGDDAILGPLRKARIELEDQIARREVATGHSDAITPEAVAAALPAGSVLIDLHIHPILDPHGSAAGRDALRWWEEPRVSAWVLRAGANEVAFVDLGVADELEAATAAPARMLAAARGVSVEEEADRVSDDWRELRRHLWDPLFEHVVDADTVFVSADGFLGTVPFEVLKDESGRFLIEDRAFVYVSDPAWLIGAADRGDREAPTTALLVGDVDYGARAADPAPMPMGPLAMLRASGSGSWQPLPGTREEVEDLAQLFEGLDPFESVTRLEGAKATEKAVEAALSQHAVLHIATHGFFQPEGATSMWDSAQEAGGSADDVAGLLPGLLSGLVFAGANLPADLDREDGLLTAEELTWLDLSQCELVTLSACETGLGSARAGEGLIGLRRAFHQAGARTVIASLWAVEDDATSRLMRSFHDALWNDGLSRSQALRRAQLELLDANREQHGEPRPWTWGAFVLSGDWD